MHPTLCPPALARPPIPPAPVQPFSDAPAAASTPAAASVQVMHVDCGCMRGPCKPDATSRCPTPCSAHPDSTTLFKPRLHGWGALGSAEPSWTSSRCPSLGSAQLLPPHPVLALPVQGPAAAQNFVISLLCRLCCGQAVCSLFGPVHIKGAHPQKSVWGPDQTGCQASATAEPSDGHRTWPYG